QRVRIELQAVAKLAAQRAERTPSFLIQQDVRAAPLVVQVLRAGGQRRAAQPAFGNRPGLWPYEDGAGVPVGEIEVAAAQGNEVARRLQPVRGRQSAPVIELEPNGCDARGDVSAQDLTEHTASQRIAVEITIANVSLKTRGVAQHEIDYSANGIRSVLRGGAIGQYVNMVDRGQGDIGYVCEQPGRSAGSRTLPINQHQGRPGVQPAHVDTRALARVGGSLAPVETRVLARTTPEHLR